MRKRLAADVEIHRNLQLIEIPLLANDPQPNEPYAILDLLDWTTPHILDNGLKLLFVLVFYFLLGRMLGVGKRSGKAAASAHMEAPAPVASPKYEEQTITVTGAKSTKAISKELARYVKSGWRIERVYDIDRKNRSVQMKRMK